MASFDSRDGVQSLLLDLSNAADDGTTSRALDPTSAIVASGVGDELGADIRFAGMTASSRDAEQPESHERM